MTTETIRTIAVLLVAFTAVAFDVRTRRIPNVLSFGAAAAALAYGFIEGGLSGAGSAAGAWMLGAALFFPFFAVGGMGAGDVKLMAAIGTWLGPGDVFYAALYAAIAGAVFAVGLALAKGCLRQTFANVQLLVLHWRVVGFVPHEQLNLGTATSPRLAYAVPILTGTAAAIWLR